MIAGARILGPVFALVVGLGGMSATAYSAELTKAEKARVQKQGELSGMAQVCGLNWRALSFRPMMSYWRRSGKSEQELALIGMLHGAAQGYFAAGASVCTNEMRRKIKTQLPFKG